MNIIKRRSTVKNSRKERKFKGGEVKPINTENFIEGEPSNKEEFYDSLNKISERYARKPVQRMFRFMHIGLVQVAFKPLTLRGLPESFIAALRDGRNHNWKK